MANEDFREPQQAARQAGLKARHETREARAIRRQVAEEIAQAILAIAHQLGDGAQRELCYDLERIAREIGSKEASA